MALGIKFNSSYFVKASRIARLPKITKKIADAATLRDAEGTIKEYKDGLRRDNFALKSLSDFTKKTRKEKGYAEGPPLVAGGENKENSLINAWEIKKLTNGYEIVLREDMHHEADLPLNILFQIHEKGIRIKVTEKMRNYLMFKGLFLKKSTEYILIPPRPTQQKAIAAWLAKRDKAGILSKAIDIIKVFLKTGTIKEIVIKK